MLKYNNNGKNYWTKNTKRKKKGKNTDDDNSNKE